MRILLVEPDVVLAETYNAVLARSGHNVILTRTAQDAVQKADQHPPDLVILEPQLARHNGVELLYEFRSYTEWQHIPLILLTHAPKTLLQKYHVLTDILEVTAILQKSQTSLQDLVDMVHTVELRQ